MTIVSQYDPLNSPFPVPWHWLVAAQQSPGHGGYSYYRTSSLISPDQQYSSYSRIRLQAGHALADSRANSVLFVEDLVNSSLYAPLAASPLGNYPPAADPQAEVAGSFSLLMPIAWSMTGRYLLSRQFEGFFCSAYASDYAVVWDSKSRQSQTLAPRGVEHSYCVLLGWSSPQADGVLFRCGILGNPYPRKWLVTLDGQTLPATDQTKAFTYGKVDDAWVGPHSGIS